MPQAYTPSKTCSKCAATTKSASSSAAYNHKYSKNSKNRDYYLRPGKDTLPIISTQHSPEPKMHCNRIRQCRQTSNGNEVFTFHRSPLTSHLSPFTFHPPQHSTAPAGVRLFSLHFLASRINSSSCGVAKFNEPTLFPTTVHG